MTTLRPIEIVGGGLAGLSLGVALRREGVPVTIHEAGTYPRHRVCGEFITGLAGSTMERLGLQDLLADALRHRQVAWFHRGSPPRCHRLPAAALGISRHVLDARLASAFRDSGGILCTNARLSPATNRPGRIFATGRRPDTRSPWIGLKIHAGNLVLVRDLEVHLGEDCYVGLARVSDEAVNVCGLFRRRALRLRGAGLLLAYLDAAGLTALAGRLNAATLRPESFCAVAAVAFDRSVSRGDRIQLGDAGAMIPPFTGNGMAMAFQSAEIALPRLLAYARGELPWPKTRQAIAAGLRARFRVRLASASALHPFLLRPPRQRWLAVLSRARLLPFGALYATLH